MLSRRVMAFGHDTVAPKQLAIYLCGLYDERGTIVVGSFNGGHSEALCG